MWKKLVTVVLVLMVVSLAACSSGGSSTGSGKKDTKKDKGLDPIGQTVKYDPNHLVNKGEPIDIEYWTWVDNDPAIALAKKYEKTYPNVKIKTVIQPWDDFWTKLPLALKGKNGPAIFNVHNSQNDLLMPYMAAYKIPVKDLEADFTSVPSHVVDGKIYYTDISINTGNIYYNKKLWKEAGLTESDIPKTWEEFTAVAKKLTKEKNDKITQAGFNFNSEAYSAMIEGLNYQKGTLLFDKDGKKVNFDNKTTKENTQFLKDLYDKEKVGSKDFGTDSSQSFGNGQSAMVYKWGWYQGELKNKYPDIDYGVFPTPTPTKDTPFAYDRYNGESTPGINKNQTKEQQAVAQDFLKYLLANDDYSKQGALNLASFPTKKSLAKDKDILADPVLKALSNRIDRLIWPGAFPAVIESTSTQTMEDVLYNGKSVDQALKDGQAKIDKEMAKSDFKASESKYKFYNEAN